MAPALGASGPDRARTAQHRQRLGRTPYDRAGRAGTSKQPPAEPNSESGSDSVPARGLASLAGRLKSALGSLWAPEPKQQPHQKRPRLVLSVPQPAYDDSDNETQRDDSVDNTELSMVQRPPVATPKRAQTGLQWRSQSGAPRRFDVSIIPNNVPGNVLPANVVISAYRQALLEQEAAATTTTTTTTKRESQPSPQLQPRKIRRKESEAVSSTRASSVVSTASTAATTAGRYNSRSWGRIRSQRAGLLPPPDPVRDHGHRIELVTRPLVDLAKLPEARKKRPGYITANFDVSDEEPEPEPVEVPSGLIRRPATDSEKTTRLAPTRSVSLSSRQTPVIEDKSEEKPVFSFSKPDTSKEAPKETQEKSTNSGLLPSLPKPAPKFEFGKSEKRGAESEPESEPKPAFALKPQTGEPEPKKAFSFGAKPSESESKPAFSFSSKPSESEPTKGFSFGSKPSESEPTKGFSFSKPSEPEPTKTFSFGSKPSEPEPKKTLTFGSTEPAKPFGSTEPAKPFGSTEKPLLGEPEPKKAFSFGAPKSADAAEPKPAEKPALFGSALKPTEGEPKPFSFGASTEPKPPTKDAEPKPAFSFGAKPDTKSDGDGFKFGAAATPAVQAATVPAVGGTATTPAIGGTAVGGTAVGGTAVAPTTGDGFKFGAAPATIPPAPATTPFTFGGDKAEKPAEKPALTFGPGTGFSFGAKPGATPAATPAVATPGAATPSTEKPAFNFGAKPASGAATDKPSFSFSSNGSVGAKPTFAFSSNSATPAPAPAPAPTPAAAPALSNGAFTFSAPTPAPAAATPFAFSSAPAPAAPAFPSNGTGFAFSTAPPAFGSNTRESTPFGGDTNAAPAFGAPSGLSSRSATPNPALPGQLPGATDMFSTTPNLAFGQAAAGGIPNRPMAKPRRRRR